MIYQLVLQWRGAFQPSHDSLIAIEDHLIDTLGNKGDVDGHDSGNDECNIFILTEAPQDCLQSVLLLLDPPYRESMMAGYRRLDGEDYVAAWPQSLTKFSIS